MTKITCSSVPLLFNSKSNMKAQFKEVPGSINAPEGFLASGVFCDIKRLGTGKGSDKGQKRDLALIVSEVPAVVAGMFTTNQVCAAPVKVCLERVKKGVAQAVAVNSGKRHKNAWFWPVSIRLGMTRKEQITTLH